MKEKCKILIVDDEPDIIEFLQFNFLKDGFEVVTTDNGLKAVELAFKYLPEQILLDVKMPYMDGVEACRMIRNNTIGYYPLICLLTANAEDYSQLAGFDAGADDYLVKPVSPKVLVTRMRALMKIQKRSLKPKESDTDPGNAISIDMDSYQVQKNNKKIEFPRKEFELLSFIASKPNRLFRREEIFNHLWGNNDLIVSDRTIDVYIRKIRSKIGDDYIKTVKGVGYKFIQ